MESSPLLASVLGVRRASVGFHERRASQTYRIAPLALSFTGPGISLALIPSKRFDALLQSAHRNERPHLFKPIPTSSPASNALKKPFGKGVRESWAAVCTRAARACTTWAEGSAPWLLKPKPAPVVKPKRELGPLGKATACNVGLMLSGLEIQSKDIADDAAEGYAQAADAYKQSRGGF